MIGKLIARAIKTVTLPIDAAEIALDYMTAGDGSRRQLKSVMPMPSDFRDRVCEAAEKVDE